MANKHSFIQNYRGTESRAVFTLSLEPRVLPKELKVALLSPILKKLKADFEQFSNFRPVSNLKFISKLIEKSVFVQLNSYLGENGLRDPLQSAYKIFHSTGLHFSLLQTTL